MKATQNLPDLPVLLPEVPDEELLSLLEKYATRLEKVLDELCKHQISQLASDNTEWARAFVLLLQFAIWDTCNVARSIQILGKKNLGRQTLALARDSLEMVVNIYWIYESDVSPPRLFLDSQKDFF